MHRADVVTAYVKLDNIMLNVKGLRDQVFPFAQTLDCSTVVLSACAFCLCTVAWP